MKSQFKLFGTNETLFSEKQNRHKLSQQCHTIVDVTNCFTSYLFLTNFCHKVGYSYYRWLHSVGLWFARLRRHKHGTVDQTHALVVVVGEEARTDPSCDERGENRNCWELSGTKSFQ